MKKNRKKTVYYKICLLLCMLCMGVVSTGLIECRCEENISDDELASIIRSSFKKKITFDIDVYPVLSKSSLQIAYDRNLILEGRGDDYSLIIKGEDIEDYNNDLDMKIEIKNKDKKNKEEYVIMREVNEELPGKVMIKIRNKKYFKKNVYLYNKVKGSYDLLDVKDMTWELDKGMKCLITNKDINEKNIDYRLLIYVAIGISMLILIYVLVKKKYWFW